MADLGFAGMISGMGNALNQGLQTMNSGIVQMGVNESLAKNDRNFQMEKLKLQMQHAERLQTDKLAADRTNTLDIVDAQNKNALALQGLRGNQAKELQGLQDTAADKRLDKQLGAQQSTELMRLGVTKELKEKELAITEKRYKDATSLEQQKLNLEKNKITLVPTEDGKMAMISPDGKAQGYLTDGQGNAIKSGKDLPESAKVELTSILEEMKGLERDKVRNGGSWTDEQTTAYENAMKTYRKQYNEVLQRHGLKTAQESAPPPVIIPDKYKNLTPGATPGPTSSVTPPGEAPGITKAPGMMGAVKGLVPGLGMVENYLRK